MSTIFKLAVLCLMLWGAYEYGYRNCEENLTISIEQAQSDLNELTEATTVIFTTGMKTAQDSVDYYKEQIELLKKKQDEIINQ